MPNDPARSSPADANAAFRNGLVAEMPNLRAFAISLSGNHAQADDLVQETLLKAWTNAASFIPGSNLRAWLFTILRNNFYSAHRRTSREVADVDGMYSERVAVPAAQDSAADMTDFRNALAKLPEDQREALIMVGASGLSYEEAAEISGVAVGTVKSRVNRARARLAVLLGIVSAADLGRAPEEEAALNPAPVA